MKDYRPILTNIQEAFTSGQLQLSARTREWLEKLWGWNGDARPGSVETTVFQTWLRELSSLPQGETGEKSWNDHVYLQNVFVRNFSDPACTTPTACLQFAAQALEKASDSAGLKWGTKECHETKFEHMIFRDTPLDCVFSRLIQHGGTESTVNVGGFGFQPNQHQTEGPSYRAIYDFSNLEESVFLNPLGQSGNVLSTQYDDLIEHWSNGGYLPMKTSNYEVKYRLTLHNN
eukprot:TRINITY_DN11870_c0_g1_i4.p1 TRINITY_DN11870_c0_g1~~TRINITY_DN11870_c0_g1_i4.p1  ORF type:complete len:251 (-),score=49.14 TRINITY_DN11870_c0_g1_i4:65-757(-)